MISLETARRVLSIVDAGLCRGVGEPTPGKMCVEAAVCYALGEPHGDQPSCVAEPDRRFKIKLNDADWSSDAARAKGLRRVAIMQLGTAGTDRSEWRKILVELTIRHVLPEALEAAAKRNPRHADRLRAAVESCRRDGSRAAALEGKAAADAAAYAADADAAYAAADAAYAAAAAAYAADADAAYAAADAAYAAAAYAERDRVLLIAARCAEEAYERTGSPGVDLMRQIEAAP